MIGTVWLDAGHYGLYNRSPAVPAYYESKRMWTLHLMLKEELEARGIPVKLTRQEQERDLALTNRGRMAKGGALLVSLHSNAVGSYVNEKVDYPVAFVQLNNARSEQIGLWLAQAVENIMCTAQSARTATRAASGDRNGDGRKNDDYYGVLYGAAQVSVPAVILEHSFHTNTRATNWLLSDDNLRRLAKAEANVIADWLGVETEEKEDNPVTYEQFKIYMKQYEAEQAAKPSTWEGDVMEAAKDAGLINDGRPKSNITRGEMAQVLKNAGLC